MAIKLYQVTIRGKVGDDAQNNGGTGQKPSGSRDSGSLSASEKDVIIKECVNEVMEKIREKYEER